MPVVAAVVEMVRVAIPALAAEILTGLVEPKLKVGGSVHSTALGKIYVRMMIRGAFLIRDNQCVDSSAESSLRAVHKGIR